MDVSSLAAQSNKNAMMANSALPVRSFTATASQLATQLSSHLATEPTSDLPTFSLTPETPNPQVPLDASLQNTSQTTTPPTPVSSVDFKSPAIPAASALSTQAQTPVASPELRKAFEDFVGQTFFAEMIKACRSGQQPSAYFHGGRAEEIFQGQLDQVLSEELSESSASKIADPMFELFMLKRQI